MKKITCLLLVLIMSLSLAAPVFAAPEDASETSVFVPSIGGPDDHPVTIVPVKDAEGNDAIGVIHDKDGNEVGYLYDNEGHGCLRVTPVAHTMNEEIIKEKKVDPDVVRLLQFVYNELKDERMHIPYEKHGDVLNGKKMVIRDLFDARWYCDEHRPQEGMTFDIKFDLGVPEDQEVFAMSYDEAANEWSPVVKTVNNGDGTVTCTFEHLCAIEFSVIGGEKPAEKEDAPAAPKEEPKPFPWIWVLILVLVIIAIIVIILVSKKNSKKNKKAAA